MHSMRLQHKIFGHSGIPNDLLLFITNQFPLHVGSQMTFGRIIYPWKILQRNKIEDFLTITTNRRILHKTFEFRGKSGKIYNLYQQFRLIIIDITILYGGLLLQGISYIYLNGQCYSFMMPLSLRVCASFILYHFHTKMKKLYFYCFLLLFWYNHNYALYKLEHKIKLEAMENYIVIAIYTTWFIYILFPITQLY